MLDAMSVYRHDSGQTLTFCLRREGRRSTASGSRARALTPDREPVEGVKCSDHGYAEERYQEAEQGACREPGQGQLKSPADGRRAPRIKGFAEQLVTARVLPDGVERQGRRVERDAVKDDRGP